MRLNSSLEQCGWRTNVLIVRRPVNPDLIFSRQWGIHPFEVAVHSCPGALGQQSLHKVSV